MTTFQPTFLYIKQHSVTGLLYFGKTTKSDPVAYKGSGKYWLRHINKHGRKFVETLWYCLYTVPDDLEAAACMLSDLLDVALSESWANLKPENGFDGGSFVGYNGFKGKTHTPEHRKHMSDMMLAYHPRKGIPLSDDIKAKMSQARLGVSHATDASRAASRQNGLRNKGRKASAETKQLMSEQRTGRSIGIIYTIQTPDGVITTDCFAAWCRDHGVDQSTMLKTLYLKRPHRRLQCMILHRSSDD